MLLALMLCYLFFYTGRQNFGWAIKFIHEEYGLSTSQLGFISGAMLACYGIGQAINGNLGDKFGGRIMVTMGALMSVVLNWITSFGTTFMSLLIPWAANGYVQSMSWAPGSRLLSNWWGHHERGRAFGWYVFSAGFSSVMIFALSILVLQHLSWQWLFRLPVLLLAIGAIIFYFVARDRPQDLGFEPLPEDPADHAIATTGEKSVDRYLHCLKNWRFLVGCVSIGFESLARYGLLIWVPFHYLGEGWKKDPSSVWITMALPVGMAFGALSSGYISDRFFRSNRSRPIALFMALASVVSLLIYVVPADNRLAGLVLLFLAGFFVYGPQSSFWALCPDLLGRRRAATGIGLMNASAYGFAAAGEPLIGWIIQLTGQTSSVFAVLAIVCMVGAVCILPIRR
ncbi:MAG: MFS transporter [Verrucomicrobia bacterium]|nr:MFS transporter [Verrucomicrobiota bacterium]